MWNAWYQVRFFCFLGCIGGIRPDKECLKMFHLCALFGACNVQCVVRGSDVCCFSVLTRNNSGGARALRITGFFFSWPSSHLFVLTYYPARNEDPFMRTAPSPPQSWWPDRANSVRLPLFLLRPYTILPFSTSPSVDLCSPYIGGGRLFGAPYDK